MRKTYRHKKKEEPKKIFPKNKAIRDPELRVIDESGTDLGVISTADALAKAKEYELDLVVVAPKARPPVAKFIDYGKFQYQQEKQLQKQKAKQKKVEVKGIRLSMRISKNDRNIRVEQAKKFLNKGHKVKFEMIVRGREHQHVDLGKNILKEVIAAINEEIPVDIESPIEKQGSKITAQIMLKKN